MFTMSNHIDALRAKTIRAANEYIIVKVTRVNNKSSIILPTDAVDSKKAICGEVISVGRGKITNSGEIVAMEISIDDQVIFNKWSATELSDDDKDIIYYAVPYKDVIAIIGGQNA